MQTGGLVIYKGSLPDIKELGASIRRPSLERGVEVLEAYGYTEQDALYKQYRALMLAKKPVRGQKEALVSEFILSTFQVVKMAEADVFYIGSENTPLFTKFRSKEALTASVSLWCQLLFGFGLDVNKATEMVVAGILPHDHYTSVDRNYMMVADNYYWSKRDATFKRAAELPPNTKVFARMFDTEYEDTNVFKVPKFDSEDVVTMLEAYHDLKTLPYGEWMEPYRYKCFEEWADGRLDVEFGMFSVLALPFMKKMPRGAVFNVGEGHNGKSVLNGLAISLVGGNNTTQVKGSDLGSWDFLVDLQTTWFNCPNETSVDFLKENTDVFKTISAHETHAMKKKFGSASVPIIGDFPMVFNINELPEFGADASAILSRMFINNFDVDFESSGKAISNYSRVTFLSEKETIPRLVGMVFAFCSYYADPAHLWEPSASMVRERNALEETAVPKNRYFSWLTEFFSSYGLISLVKQDFINFGRMEGEIYDGSVIKSKDILFKRFKRGNSKYGTVYKLPTDKNYPVERHHFYERSYYKKYMGAMSLVEYHDAGHSLVYDMMVDLLAHEEQVRAELRTSGAERTPEEIRNLAKMRMFRELDTERKGLRYESGR